MAPAGSKTAGSTDLGGEGEYRPAACERGVERRNAARLARIRRPAYPRRTALALCADSAHARLLFLCLLSRHPRIPDRIVAGAGHGGGDRVRRGADGAGAGGAGEARAVGAAVAAGDRQSVVSGKRVSGGVGRRGRRYIQKTIVTAFDLCEN